MWKRIFPILARSRWPGPFLAAVTLLALVPPAGAAEDLVPTSRYASARAQALGGAYLPLANDAAAALFFNPAAIARLRGPHLSLEDFSFDGDAGFFSQLDTHALAAPSLSGSASTLAKNPGTWHSTGGGWTPSFGFEGFAAGVTLQTRFTARDNGDGTIRYRPLYLAAPAIGTGIRLAEGVVRIGYSLQWVNQATGDMTVPSDASPLGFNQGIAQGSGLSHTVGFALTLPYQYLPALNVVARNIGGTHYQSTSLLGFARNSSGTPPDDPMSVDASVSLLTKLGGGNSAYWILEGRDLSASSSMSALGRLSAGLEFSVQNAVFVRAGFGSGYPSAGLGLKRQNSQLDLTWYSEELGTGYHQDRDARIALQYRWNVF